jgi:hypothetical protein
LFDDQHEALPVVKCLKDRSHSAPRSTELAELGMKTIRQAVSGFPGFANI